jgi:hypothetical protein
VGVGFRAVLLAINVYEMKWVMSLIAFFECVCKGTCYELRRVLYANSIYFICIG